MDVITRRSDQNYSTIFLFEDAFNQQKAIKFMEQYWFSSIYISLVYLFVVFDTKRHLSSRPAFNTKRWLAVWNSLLFVFSTMGAARTFPELYYGLTEKGFRHCICDTSYILENKVTSFWGFLFVMSKVPELGDTLFIVLRKQKLTFLHVAHHSLTLVSSWFVYKEVVGISRWFVAMNYCVHTVMYSYFALRALNVKLPKIISMAITTAQMTQMFLGFYVSVHASVLYWYGIPCHITKDAAMVSVSVYLFYFFLFAKFFVDNYVGVKKTDVQSKKSR